LPIHISPFFHCQLKDESQNNQELQRIYSESKINEIRNQCHFWLFQIGLKQEMWHLTNQHNRKIYKFMKEILIQITITKSKIINFIWKRMNCFQWCVIIRVRRIKLKRKIIMKHPSFNLMVT
jgi:hypothetical protein